jgi:excisionase family DNA binding protein
VTPTAASQSAASPPRRRSNPARSPGAERTALLDVSHLADWLGVEVVFVRRLVSERRIPFVKIGKYVRFDPDEIAAWMDGLRVRPTPRSAGRNQPRYR